jgi:predicted CoA-substrate-specific enzyme activase
MPPLCAGIDAGSRATKVVLIDASDGRVRARGAVDQGVRQNELATELLDRLLAKAGATRDDLAGTVATGYARNLIDLADTTVTEITCHGRGVHAVCPEARTVVEIGGQDSKLLRLADDGTVRDFAMNDRCAAGTGRFLEVVSVRLGVPLDELDGLLAKSREPATISSMCVVFAETEIIGLLARGTEPADIVAGVVQSIARRVAAMVGREATAPVLFTGGVALVPGMADALSAALETEVEIVADPQYTGALGAALRAGEQARASSQ